MRNHVSPLGGQTDQALLQGRGVISCRERISGKHQMTYSVNLTIIEQLLCHASGWAQGILVRTQMASPAVEEDKIGSASMECPVSHSARKEMWP